MVSECKNSAAGRSVQAHASHLRRDPFLVLRRRGTQAAGLVGAVELCPGSWDPPSGATANAAGRGSLFKNESGARRIACSRTSASGCRRRMFMSAGSCTAGLSARIRSSFCERDIRRKPSIGIASTAGSVAAGIVVKQITRRVNLGVGVARTEMSRSLNWSESLSIR